MRTKFPSNNIQAADETESDNNIVLLGGDQKRKPYQLYEQTFESKAYHFYISEEIAEPALYTDMIYKISTANQNDTVIMHLNTTGGNIATGIQLILALQNCPGKTISILEGEAYSLGTLILLACDEIVISDNCMIMIHNFSGGGMSGKGHEQQAALESTIKWFTHLAKDVYIPFLSEDEFQRVLKGEDIWMLSSDVRKRLDRMMKDEQEPKVKKHKVIKIAEEVEVEIIPEKPTPKRKPKTK